jgi:hypothetical protein
MFLLSSVSIVLFPHTHTLTLFGAKFHTCLSFPFLRCYKKPLFKYSLPLLTNVCILRERHESKDREMGMKDVFRVTKKGTDSFTPLSLSPLSLSFRSTRPHTATA